MSSSFSIFKGKVARALDRSTALVQTKLEQLPNLSDAELQASADEFRIREMARTERPRSCWRDESLLSRVALAAEAARRSTGLCLRPVQIMATVATAQGMVIEMRTGEGKSLVAATAAVAVALLGRGVHISTTNAYLAERDYAQFAESAKRLGLTSSITSQNSDRSERERTYDADLVYGAGCQFGFDYLHSQIDKRANAVEPLGTQTLKKLERSRKIRTTGGAVECHEMIKETKRNPFFAVVDEVDSVLIDEAATPLVLSGAPSQTKSPALYELAKKIAEGMREGEDFRVDVSSKSIRILKTRGFEELRNRDLIHPTIERPWSIYLRNALTAKHVLSPGVDYVVQDGKARLIDRVTGRLHQDRHFQNGLQEAVEVEAGIGVQPRSTPIARTTRQAFYARYSHLAGMSGTIDCVADELRQTYGVRYLTIPTHRPCQLAIYPTLFFRNQQQKIEAITYECERLRNQGRPVLIGTRTLTDSQVLSAALSKNGVSHNLLNGLQDLEEAEIIAQAGHSGAVTVATNMAGRGTDIAPCERSLNSGGLHVIGFEHNESKRLDLQLAGRAGRQGNPGSAQFFGSPQDWIFEWGEMVRSNQNNAPTTGSSQGKECRASQAYIRKMQARWEATEARRRQQLLQSEEWMNEVRKTLAHTA